MGENLFVCECGKATSDYRGGQCGNCDELHCQSCHEKFLAQYGEKRDCLAKCNKCEDDTSDEESDEETKEEIDEESDDESDEETNEEIKKETKKESEIIWRASGGFVGESADALYKNKEHGNKYIISRVKELLEDLDSYDEDGELSANLWELGLQKFELN